MSSEDEPLLLEEPAEVKVEESGLAGVEQVEDSRFVGKNALIMHCSSYVNPRKLKPVM